MSEMHIIPLSTPPVSLQYWHFGKSPPLEKEKIEWCRKEPAQTTRSIIKSIHTPNQGCNIRFQTFEGCGRACGIWVVLPHPVSPMSTVTPWVSTRYRMDRRCLKIGRLSLCFPKPVRDLYLREDMNPSSLSSASSWQMKAAVAFTQDKEETLQQILQTRKSPLP